MSDRDLQTLDIGWVREQFSLPPKLPFFDNAGGSFTLNRVIEATAAYMRSKPVQLGATYPLSLEAAHEQRAATAALAEFVNARDDEIVLGPSSSSLLDRLARAHRPLLQAGDEVVVSEFDHEANISPWLRLQDQGVTIKWWRLNQDTQRPDPADLQDLLTDRTKLVCVTHCSNIFGDILPVREIADLVHSAGAKVVVDGVAFAPHMQVNVAELDADFYVFSLYKTFGPHLGLMFGKRSLLEGLGNINLEHLPAGSAPYTLQPGGACYELVAGAATVPSYIQELGARVGAKDQEATSALRSAFTAIAYRERRISARILDAINQHPHLSVVGLSELSELRLPIIAFRSSARSSEAVCEELVRHGVAAKYGHFHSIRLIKRLGLDPNDGVVRVSAAHYTSDDDIGALLAALGTV